MSGIGLVTSIAKDALSAQRYGMDVTAHNIANVNTEGYSRQNPIYESRAPATIGGLFLGRGVTTDQIARISDEFIEDRLMQQKSNMFYSDELENYMQVLEGFFNENAETSISTMLVDFWNLWHDVSNNPSGGPERSALFEYSDIMTTQFNALDASMKQLEVDLSNSISVSVNDINQLTEQIAYLNGQIMTVEADATANDLRDNRSNLISKLAQYIDIETFEQPNGSVTVVSVRGSTLVDRNSNYQLTVGGSDGNRLLWQSSGGATIDLTNYVTKGSVGGYLDMRDEIIAKYELDMDALTKELVWVTNQQHSQGIGLTAFSSITGDYATTSATDAVGTSASGLTFYDKIQDGSFTLWLYDENGDVVVPGGTTITIDADVTPLADADPATNDIATMISAIDPNINATVTNGQLVITGANDYTFGFSDDSSNVLAALAINTFFSGSTAGNIEISDRIQADKNNIAAAKIAGDGTFSMGDNTNALAISDLQYTPLEISQWSVDRATGAEEGTVTSTIEEYFHNMVSSIGIKSASISREKDFNDVMVIKLTEVRDEISAVSLDEEMTNLVKYQHAFAAAAKLITTADEMLVTLLEIK